MHALKLILDASALWKRRFYENALGFDKMQQMHADQGEQPLVAGA